MPAITAAADSSLLHLESRLSNDEPILNGGPESGFVRALGANPGDGDSGLGLRESGPSPPVHQARDVAAVPQLPARMNAKVEMGAVVMSDAVAQTDPKVRKDAGVQTEPPAARAEKSTQSFPVEGTSLRPPGRTLESTRASVDADPDEGLKNTLRKYATNLTPENIDELVTAMKDRGVSNGDLEKLLRESNVRDMWRSLFFGAVNAAGKMANLTIDQLIDGLAPKSILNHMPVGIFVAGGLNLYSQAIPKKRQHLLLASRVEEQSRMPWHAAANC